MSHVTSCRTHKKERERLSCLTSDCDRIYSEIMFPALVSVWNSRLYWAVKQKGDGTLRDKPIYGSNFICRSISCARNGGCSAGLPLTPSTDRLWEETCVPSVLFRGDWVHHHQKRRTSGASVAHVSRTNGTNVSVWSHASAYKSCD